jgi:tRNA pseudouridine38-40 synthase
LRKLAALVEYDGTGFSGWQSQQHAPSIQDAVESALSFVAGHAVTATCAGRTDAGVHAAAQVIHFESDSRRTPRAWVLGANTRLPPSVALHWAGEVAPDFHARHKAERRVYRYYILNRSARSPLQRDRTAWIHRGLDAPVLNDAAQVLIGEHDFSAFRSVECQSKSAVRKIDSLSLHRSGDYVWLEIRATAFLHHMVRNIVGTLIHLMDETSPRQALLDILDSRDRRLAGPTAPPGGLFFWRAEYPERYGIPTGLADLPFVGL